MIGCFSAVEFIAQDEDDPTAGSPGLRRSVIAQTTAETADIDFNQAVSPRPVVHAVLLSIIICSAGGDAGDARSRRIANGPCPAGQSAWQRRLAAKKPPCDPQSSWSA